MGPYRQRDCAIAAEVTGVRRTKLWRTKKNPRMAMSLKRADAVLRDFALAFPQAHEEFPWGHRR